MGMNYYHRTNFCTHCERYDQEHIGKSSAGWTFTFHATPTIRSWREWRDALAHGAIFNERNQEVSVEEFFLLVEMKKSADWNHARDVYDHDSAYNRKMREQYPSHHTPVPNAMNFLDDEGNSFSEGEFS